MKSDKKFTGKKRKKEGIDFSEESSIEKKSIDNKYNIIRDNNPNLENCKIIKSINTDNENNNNTIRNDTMNNNILISKKEASNDNNSSKLFTFNKSPTFFKDTESNENEAQNKNEIPSSKTNNNLNEPKEKNILLKANQINNSINSRNQQTNSAYSDNSEDSQSSSPQVAHRTQSKSSNPKFKSHLSNSRNTAFGLKEISKRVMEIIKQSGQTTYKAISDQIVNEINEKNTKDDKKTKDEKNIRRRIYDSLNVMKSMKLFHRDKNSKTIMWNYDQEFDPLNEIENKNEGDDKNNECKEDSKNIIELKKNIKEKKEKCTLLSKELKGLKNVLERNNREDKNVEENNKLYFPFIVIEFQNNKDPKINIALNEDQTKAHLGFDEAETMYGDLDMVSKIGNHPNFSKLNNNNNNN